MHRLLVDSAQLEAERPDLPKEAARHLRVLRPEPGERVELFDGRGGVRAYAFADGALVAAEAVRRLPRPAREIVLFACVTKGSRWDWTVEKATELGVTRLVPVISARTIVRLGPGERPAKRARWQRVAEDAARQSDAAWLPEIAAPVDFADALPLAAATDCFAGALTTPPSPPLAAALLRRAADPASARRPCAAFIGPEGDFTPEELAALLEVATPASFGPTVLRAETAALYAMALISALAVGSARHGDGGI